MGIGLRRIGDPAAASDVRSSRCSCYVPAVNVFTTGSREKQTAPGSFASGSDDADDIALDIRLAALRQVAECQGEEIDTLLADAAGSDSPKLRAAAIDSIARRAAAMPLSAVLAVRLTDALDDREPPVRAAAARALAPQGDAARHLASRLEDPVDAVRAAAVSAVATTDPERVACGFSDPSPLVRRAAIDGTAAHGNTTLLEEGIWIMVEGGWADSLAEASRRHPEARRLLLVRLSREETLSRQSVLMVLEALARAT